ncbi:hypothetical protein AVEN_183294-1 [Araneus ventricosus]|uniref:Transposable element Tc3 transposase n=1 Tax=Araneus ventricosus TaxID=182803 RepID=A0A4Y2ERM7_ARAVE|nr:hypothetical protein AVEN_183294-1 [Araneus ventricosus]
MQDGAPPHNGLSVQRLFGQHFTEERVIGRFFPLAWPPLSPDPTSCDFFLWGYLKSNVYLGGVTTLTTLKDNISRAVLNILGDMLRLAVENLVYRMQCVVDEKGSHIERGLCPHRRNAFIE